MQFKFFEFSFLVSSMTYYNTTEQSFVISRGNSSA